MIENSNIFIVCQQRNDACAVSNSITKYTPGGSRIFLTAQQGSCSYNHNFGLSWIYGDFAVSFHDDIEILSGDWLDKMMKTMLSDDRIALVGPKLVLPDNTIHSCGTNPRLRPYCYHEKDTGQREFAQEVVALDCNVYLYRMEAFKDIKFDEWFTGSSPFSDTDICLRLRKKGWKIFYDGRVKMLHKKPQTNGNWCSWNHLWFHLKHGYAKTIIV